MLSSSEVLAQIVHMNLNHNDYQEDYKDVLEHIKVQMDDGLIRWVEEGNKVLAYADYFWLKDYEDVYIYEETGICPNGVPGRMLYVNNCVIDSSDKNIIWRLLSKRPSCYFICWKRDNGRLKTWRNHVDTQRV